MEVEESADLFAITRPGRNDRVEGKVLGGARKTLLVIYPNAIEAPESNNVAGKTLMGL